MKIELLDTTGNIRYAAEGESEVLLNIDSYNDGDRLVFKSNDSKYVWVSIHKDIAECLIYLTNSEFHFDIPTGQAKAGFAPNTFSGNQTVRMRAASDNDIHSYRNLCLNPLDYRRPSEVVNPDAPEWSNPKDSEAFLNGEITEFPHAYANRVTRNEGCFYARNAIDGYSDPNGHGNYPYHSWGGAVHKDLVFSVYFGRPVKVDKLVLCLRSDFSLDDKGREHDTYWHTARIELSDGFGTEIHPIKTPNNQEFELGEHTTEWLKLSRLDPLQHDMSQNFAALTQIELWGKD